VRPSDLAAASGTGATRRFVLATGAKLAYAVPVVAATMKLAALDAAAACACPAATATAAYFEVTGGAHAGECAVCPATATGYSAGQNQCTLPRGVKTAPSGFVAKVCTAAVSQ
jgi:hypothetical protein